jgi:hypothetical protein
MIKLLKLWWYSSSFKDTGGMALTFCYYNTQNPIEFIAAVREMRKRYGMTKEHVKIVNASKSKMPTHPESRIINSGTTWSYNENTLGWSPL